jgi:hypothetical protein
MHYLSGDMMCEVSKEHKLTSLKTNKIRIISRQEELSQVLSCCITHFPPVDMNNCLVQRLGANRNVEDVVNHCNICSCIIPFEWLHFWVVDRRICHDVDWRLVDSF